MGWRIRKTDPAVSIDVHTSRGVITLPDAVIEVNSALGRELVAMGVAVRVMSEEPGYAGADKVAPVPPGGQP